MRRLIIIAACCGVALGGAAIAASSSSGSEGPGDVAEEYLEAILRGDGEAACDRMTADLKKELLVAAAFMGGGNGCAGVMENAGDFMPGKGLDKYPDDQKVAWERLHGNTATVKMEGAPEPAQMKKVNGEWLVAGS